MQVRIEDVSPVEKKLIVEVPWDSVSDKLGASFKELGKSVQLKGFRKGKVPRSVLERMFGKRVRAEVAGQLVQESFLTAVTQHNLQAVSEPQVDSSALDIVKGQPFAFEAIVEVRGDVEAADYIGMELTKRPLEVSEDEVGQSLEQLQREHTELHPIEGRTELSADDVVAIKVVGTVGEHAIDRDQLTVDLGDTEHEPFPGLASALIGLPIAAQDHELELSVPDDHSEESIAGQTGKFTISVLDARVKDVPAFDDDFAADTGKGETMDELRAALRKELEDQKASSIQDELRQAATAELVKRNQIPVASSLIDRVIENKMRRFQMMMGMEPGETGVDDAMRQELGAGAADEVRGQLLLESVAEKENIEVTEEELDARIAEMAARANQSLGRLKADMDRDGRLDNLRFQVRHEKTLDFLIDKAQVTEKEPEPEPEPQAAGGEGEAEGEGEPG